MFFCLSERYYHHISFDHTILKRLSLAWFRTVANLIGIIGATQEQYERSKDQTSCSSFCSVSQSITRCTCLNGGFIVELNALVNVLVLGCVSDFPLLHTKYIPHQLN